MLNIGDKICRNIQEQVAYNSKCIQAIKDYLDGLEISDSLIVLTSSSGSLTAEEMAVAQKKVAFIYLNGELYVKSEDVVPSSYIFRQVKLKATEVGSAYYEIGGSKIVVTIGTATYAQSDEVVITVYSKSQVDSIVANIMAIKANVADVYTKTAVDLLLAGKADLSGANFTGDVTARTLSSNQAEYEANFNVYNLPAGLSIKDSSYKAFKVINNVLWIIAVLWIENTTESVVSGSFTLYNNNVPSNIGSKIYKADGTNLTSASPAGLAREICDIPTMFKMRVGNPQNIYSRITSPSENRLDVSISNVQVDANDEALVSIRCPIILL